MLSTTTQCAFVGAQIDTIALLPACVRVAILHHWPHAALGALPTMCSCGPASAWLAPYTAPLRPPLPLLLLLHPTGLQKLYEKYKSSGLEVLAFPCDQFGHQEPGSDADIKHFATSHYHTTFPMFHKIDVNGANTHPVYQYLKQELHIQVIDHVLV